MLNLFLDSKPVEAALETIHSYSKGYLQIFCACCCFKFSEHPGYITPFPLPWFVKMEYLVFGEKFSAGFG